MTAHERRSDPWDGRAERGVMGRRCVLAMDGARRAELERLSRSAVRGEADRARAVLWSLAGETSGAVAARLGVRPEQVRRWRGVFRSGGAAALRSRPGRTPRKREAAPAACWAGRRPTGRPGPWPGWRGRSRRAPARRSPPVT